MTTYHAEIIEHPDDGAMRTLANIDTEDPIVAAAVLRATADRLDPPKPPRPVYRGAADRREAADQRFREKLAGYGDQATGNAYDAQCRGSDCNEGHTYLPGCLLAPPRPATRAQIDAMVCPDCIGDAHTYEPGRCALKPPWNGVVVRGDGKAPGTTPTSS